MVDYKFSREAAIRKMNSAYSEPESDPESEVTDLLWRYNVDFEPNLQSPSVAIGGVRRSRFNLSFIDWVFLGLCVGMIIGWIMDIKKERAPAKSRISQISPFKLDWILSLTRTRSQI